MLHFLEEKESLQKLISKNNQSLLFGRFQNETLVEVCGQNSRCSGILGGMVKTETRSHKSFCKIQELGCLQKTIQSAWIT